ncbi:response regulator transcription factor [Micromonospora inyonensis]|uniref:Two-component system, NarL family, response regulator DesR n=1 Tax=Micromonospora inyonensis TaxID=47866 RepID=A0A1C6SB94_9ACTN|nr:response regulator transcription factor [Micromonospora inyonensis]SCL26686.1 two-component system, NarL family, response regulator DesR [Micromonospora inyonensis]
MIRTLLALDGTLIRGALALVLAAEQDISVVAEVDRGDEVQPMLWTKLPDMAVVDLDLIDDGAGPVGPCPMLVLADRRRVRGLHHVLVGGRTVGVLANDVSPHRVVDGVRRLARGETVVDAELVLAALTATSPLTGRETEILELTAAGATVAEVAGSLGLSPGTVRNHLGRITRKAGARTRVEAVRLARDAGWI